MTEVECLFEVHVDGDGYVHWDLISVGEVGSGFHKKYVETETKVKMTSNLFVSIWPGEMRKDNNYTYYGQRRDCPVFSEDRLGPFFGFVVEKMKLNKCNL